MANNNLENEKVEAGKKTTKSKVSKNVKKKSKTTKKTTKPKTKKGKKKTLSKTSESNGLRATRTYTKKSSNDIHEELQKITNIKSVEQIKKPKKIALLVSFYSVIVIAIAIFCFIKFSKTSVVLINEKETISYDLTEIETTSVETVISDKETDKPVSTISTIKNENVSTKSETKADTNTKKVNIKPWPVRKNVSQILPKYNQVLYSYATFYHMTIDEIGIINNELTENYKKIKDNLFGTDVPFDTKGKNGIVYLNYEYLQEFVKDYNYDIRKAYDDLPLAPYYEYIMNDKFKYSSSTYTTNLTMDLDFKNAKFQGYYYNIPATIYEPKGANVTDGGAYKTIIRVLKRAKVGYTEDFNLTSLLEVLDIECNTKHNPFFDIEDVVGAYPKAIKSMEQSGIDIKATIESSTFNYVLFDKKGYVTALYMLR